MGCVRVHTMRSLISAAMYRVPGAPCFDMKTRTCTAPEYSAHAPGSHSLCVYPDSVSIRWEVRRDHPRERVWQTREGESSKSDLTHGDSIGNCARAGYPPPYCTPVRGGKSAVQHGRNARKTTFSARNSNRNTKEGFSQLRQVYCVESLTPSPSDDDDDDDDGAT